MPPRTRIPTVADFEPLKPELIVSLAFPSPPESTTAILILFHGLGDSEASFATFAKNLALPGVLGISVRGTSPLPPVLLGEPLTAGPTKHFHWGDDLTLSPHTGELDPDPGFSKAERLILDRLLGETLVQKCGWEPNDLLLFGFGQGGSLALGLASRIRVPPQVEDVTEDGKGGVERKRVFKGVVSVGGPLPHSMVPSISAREKSKTPVLVCHGTASEAVDEDAIDTLKQEFTDVRVAKWKRPDDGVPRNRDEVLPMMQFFAERLRSGW
ncbi:phospholipase/Carboxylesterase superfamily protein [Thozetella sp. PMI_491]|nr:phospholipase/Carboxylesterase superfamily protein [Thozetella sp. PMI_491]